MKLPVISLAILGGQIAWASQKGTYNLLDTLDNFQSLYTGFDFTENRFHAERLMGGYVPWLVKRFAGAVARPRMPIRGLPISLS